MNDKKKQIDPLPEECLGYEETSDLRDKHDTTDYDSEFETVEAGVNLKRRRFKVELDADLMPALTERADY